LVLKDTFGRKDFQYHVAQLIGLFYLSYQLLGLVPGRILSRDDSLETSIENIWWSLEYLAYSQEYLWVYL